MSSAQQALNELGRRLAMGDLILSPEGTLSLDIEGVGRIAFELAFEEEMLISLFSRLEPYDKTTLITALGFSSLSSKTFRPIRVGLIKDKLILSILFHFYELDAEKLEDAIIGLIKIKNNIYKNY
jgi:hypothetical protein